MGFGHRGFCLRSPVALFFVSGWPDGQGACLRGLVSKDVNSGALPCPSCEVAGGNLPAIVGVRRVE